MPAMTRLLTDKVAKVRLGASLSNAGSMSVQIGVLEDYQMSTRAKVVIAVTAIVVALIVGGIYWLRTSPTVAQDACLDSGGAWRDNMCAYQ